MKVIYKTLICSVLLLNFISCEKEITENCESESSKQEEISTSATSANDEARPCEVPQVGDVDDVDADTPETLEPEITPEDPSTDTHRLTINYVLQNFNNDQENKMRDALELLEQVINSPAFKARVLAHQYKGKSTFYQNDDLTNLQIYNKIMAGAEELSPEQDYEMDLDITLYYKNNGTVGYTRRNTNRNWVNNKFFRRYPLSKVAANAVHEWMHKIGFRHSQRRTSIRKYTVPYAVGTIIKELIESTQPQLD